MMHAEQANVRSVSLALFAALTLAAGLLMSERAAAQQDNPAAVKFKAMSDYLAAQKTLSATFDSEVEVVTSDLQKVQFSSSGQMLLARPDKMHLTRTGGFTDAEVIYDGKTLSVAGKRANVFAQIELPGTIDQVIDQAQNRLNIALPGTDLLLSNVYDALMADVIDAKYIGPGVVDGVQCDHLAFRDTEFDWQIWIETGARPLPRKYVITSKTLSGGPQYTLRIKDWKTDPQIDANSFAFKGPAGATGVVFEQLAGIDEIPPGKMPGAKP